LIIPLQLIVFLSIHQPCDNGKGTSFEMKLGHFFISAPAAIALMLSATSCHSVDGANEIALGLVKLPPGFEISLYAAGIPNARSMVMSSSGTLFVGTRKAGRIYAVLDHDGDFRADETVTLADGLNMPNGVAFRDGSLYVAEVNRILRYDQIEQNLRSVPKPVIVNDSFPRDEHHGWKYIAIGPDGMLYVPVGAPCNICEKDATTAGIGWETTCPPTPFSMPLLKAFISAFRIVMRGISRIQNMDINDAAMNLLRLH
jgi:glucose/arabinose dehydrogenase